MASLALRNVVKTFGVSRVIHGVNLDIASGEFVVLVGPSGCGKSTLLRMIAGLEPISSGDLLVDGQRMNDVPAADRGLAMVFQSYALYPHMTVYQNLAFGLENTRIKRAEIDRRVEGAARLLQIDGLLTRKPRQLSGGQRQRVAIGRAITREPRVFLFDEPLSNLDAELRVQMRVELTKLHERLGNTMIYVTHDQVEAMTMADKIVVLRAGRIEQIGGPLDVYNSPDNRFVAGFLGSPRMNFLEGHVVATTSGSVHVDVASLPALVAAVEPADTQIGEPVLVGIRPEHIRLEGPADATSLHVELVEQLGGESYIYGTLTSGEKLVVHCGGQVASQPGDRIGLMFAPEHLYVFRKTAGERALKRAVA